MENIQVETWLVSQTIFLHPAIILCNLAGNFPQTETQANLCTWDLALELVVFCPLPFPPCLHIITITIIIMQVYLT
ncbi:hypothetical protein BGZ63DRAFT_121867 [Mariannaea sp. PMI_226]|nr:hypothetical protein BGZ63DRAFT_121867 [Mariannaea sp. PMI_226]